MKKIKNCLICNSDQIIIDKVVEKDGSYSQCLKCKTIFVNPLASYDEAVNRLAETEYTDFYFS